jgi:hypothetical protein
LIFCKKNNYKFNYQVNTIFMIIFLLFQKLKFFLNFPLKSKITSLCDADFLVEQFCRTTFVLLIIYQNKIPLKQ